MNTQTDAQPPNRLATTFLNPIAFLLTLVGGVTLLVGFLGSVLHGLAPGKLLDGQSPANIEGVLQYALNLAIDADLDHDPSHVSITLDQVARALDVVAPQA